MRSFFTEIPGFPNVGSPVNLRRNQRKRWNAEELRVEQENVLRLLSTAGVEEMRKDFELDGKCPSLQTEPEQRCLAPTVVPSFLLGMRARPSVSRETPWGQ